MISRVFLPVLLAATLSTSAFAQQFPGLGDQFAPSDERARDRDRDRGEDRDRNNDRGREQQQVREVPLSTILRNLRSQYGGQHLDAQKTGDRYRISWITDDGRRLTIEVDATTGRTLSVRG